MDIHRIAVFLVVTAFHTKPVYACANNTHVNSIVGGAVTLNCIGYISGHVTWVKQGITLASSINKSITTQNNIEIDQECNIRILDITPNETGVYCCNFQNKDTAAECCLELELAHLVIQSENEQIHGSDGEEIEVSCNLSIPIADATLFLIYNKSIISSNIASSLTSNVSVSSLQHGHYIICEASIGNQTLETTAELNITYKPLVKIITSPPDRMLFAGGNASWTCLFESNPNATNLTWTKDGRKVSTQMVLSINDITENDSGVYECSVYNSLGSGVEFINVSIRYAPEKPLDFSVEAIGTGFRCVWVSGESGGLSQSFYVKYRNRYSSAWVITGPIQDGSVYDVTGLLPDTDYDVTMYSQNDIGKSNQTTITRVRTLLQDMNYDNGLTLYMYILSTFGMTVILLSCAFIKKQVKKRSNIIS